MSLRYNYINFIVNGPITSLSLMKSQTFVVNRRNEENLTGIMRIDEHVFWDPPGGGAVSTGLRILLNVKSNSYSTRRVAVLPVSLPHSSYSFSIPAILWFCGIKISHTFPSFISFSFIFENPFVRRISTENMNQRSFVFVKMLQIKVLLLLPDTNTYTHTFYKFVQIVTIYSQRIKILITIFFTSQNKALSRFKTKQNCIQVRSHDKKKRIYKSVERYDFLFEKRNTCSNIYWTYFLFPNKKVPKLLQYQKKM